VVVVDVSNRAQPRLESQITGFSARDAVAQGDWLYTCAGNDFNVVDITTPSAAALVASLEFNPGSGAAAISVDVAGDVAFVTGGGPSLGNYPALRSIDVSDRSDPVPGPRSNESGGLDVVVEGSHAFVSAYDEGVFIYDVSNPLSELPLVARLGTGGIAARLLVQGGILYVFNASNSTPSLAVIDVSDPGTPDLLSIAPIPWLWLNDSYGSVGYFVGMAMETTRLYLGGAHGVVVIDITDPANVDPLGRVDPATFVGGVSALGGEVLVAHRGGVSVVEILSIPTE
jgi:hypothetical protein